MNAIDRLLNPRSIAVVGASGDPEKLTGRPIVYLQKHGFSGEIFPVNPRVPPISGLRCYPDVQSLPIAPDVGLVLLAPDRAEDALRALAARGAAAAIVLAGGYGETGPAGAARQTALRAAAGPMRLLGPNTIGIVNVTNRVTLSATGALEIGDLPEGKISVVSQSGGILGALLSRAADRGIGFAKLVATGNEADLDVADILEALIDDPSTAALVVYLETLRRLVPFRRAAERAAEFGKPIVVYKVGRSEAGARSAVSHTGALAGSDRLYDALFRQLGIIRAETFNDLIDIPAALATGRRAQGRHVAVLTSTGGAGTLLADSCGLAGFELPAPDGETAHRLAQIMGGGVAAGIENPLDVTLAGLRPALLQAAMAALIESPSYDALIVVAGASAIAHPALAADAAAACLSLSHKPLLAYVSPHAPEAVRRFNACGIPAVTTPETCAAILTALTLPRPERRRDPEPGRETKTPALPVSSGPLNEVESKALFAGFGIPCPRQIVVRNANEAEAAARSIGGPVVLKMLSRAVTHKSDLGGVRLGLSPQSIRGAFETMRTTIGARGVAPTEFLVEEQVADGLQFILGLRRDPQLGLAVMVGLGGMTAELIADTAIRLLPISRRDAETMIGELRSAPLLTGYRGAPLRDITALVDALLAFAPMGEALSARLGEAEINPLFVLHDGRGVSAGDGVVVLT